MPKFYGAVGYGQTVETSADSGVYVDQITEVKYYGDVVRNTRQMSDGQGLNEDLSVNNLISIVADAYALEHMFAMRYIEWQGVRWDVRSVEVQRPRLILQLGGVYNGPGPTEDATP